MADGIKKHVVLDTETLGVTTPDAVILSIGVTTFSFEDEGVSFKSLVKEGINLKLNVKEQMKAGRIIEDDTMQFWKEQGEDAKKILKPSPNDLTVEQACKIIKKYISTQGVDGWYWSRGNEFDFGKIRSLYRMAGIEVPWHGNKERDIRTMIDCFTGSENGKVKISSDLDGFIYHNSLHDASKDALTMWEIYQTILNGD